MNMDDRRLTTRHIANSVDTSHDRVDNTLRNEQCTTLVSTRWVPCLLTTYLRSRFMNSRENLRRFQLCLGGNWWIVIVLPVCALNITTIISFCFV